MLEAEITTGGDVLVEGQHVGQLHGFRFTPDPQASGEAARALNAAALKALGGEIEARAERFSAAVDESFALANDGTIRWLGDPVAKIAPGDKLLAPRARVIADEHLTGTALETVQRRLDLWLGQHIKKHLGPLMELETGEGLEGMSRGIAFQVAEALGVLERARVAEEMKSLDQASRGTLRKLGLRFGAYHIYLPALIKPAPRALAAQLWALRHGGVETIKGLDEVPHLASSGRTSFAADQTVPKGLYRAAGFRVCGTRAVRVDILERLADLIRPAIAYRPGTTPGAPPPGAADNDGFVTTVSMTSLAGCSGEDFASILRALGYVHEQRAGPAITVPLVPSAPTEPLKPQVEAAAPAAGDAPAAEEAPTPLDETSDDATVGPTETPAEGDEPAEFRPEPEGVTESPEAAATEAAADELTDPAEDPPMASEPQAPSMPPEVPAEAATVPEPPIEVEGDVTESYAVEAVLASEPMETSVHAIDTAEPTQTAAEPMAEAVMAVEPVDPVVPEAPSLIDVWRPHRTHNHAQRRPERSRPRHGHRGAAPTVVPDARPAEEPGVAARRPDDRRPSPGRDRRPSGAPGKPQYDSARPHRAADRTGGLEPAAAEAAQPSQPDRRGPKDGGRPPRHGDGKGRFENRRGDNGRGDSRPQTFSSQETRPARDRQPDPNSPFAKLMALKLELERKKEP